MWNDSGYQMYNKGMHQRNHTLQYSTAQHSVAQTLEILQSRSVHVHQYLQHVTCATISFRHSFCLVPDVHLVSAVVRYSCVLFCILSRCICNWYVYVRVISSVRLVVVVKLFLFVVVILSHIVIVLHVKRHWIIRYMHLMWILRLSSRLHHPH
jgi:hypothetical protein